VSGPHVTWEHGDAFDKALDDWFRHVQDATRTALAESGRIVADETRAGFGQAPAPTSRSGALAGSVGTSAPHTTSSGYEVQIGPQGVIYARKQELGKRRPYSSGPHPYFKPGFLRAGARFQTIFADAWRRAAPKG